MKKVYTVPLVLAAGMTTSAHAADIDISDDTTVSLWGALEVGYQDETRIENANPDSGSTVSDSDLLDKGSVFGLGGEHDFGDGYTAYVGAEFVFDVLRDNEQFDNDEAYAGVRGDFGDVRIGSYDNNFIEAVYDYIDPFEEASLTEEGATEDQDTLAYYSPSYGGFSYELQTRVKGDRNPVAGSDSSEYALIGVARYTADRWEVTAGFDDRGTDFVDVNAAGDDGTQQDPVYGVAGAFQATDRLGVSARFTQEGDASDAANDIAYYGAAVEYDYGGGTLYGALQEVDPDEGDSRTQFAAGANYFFADAFYSYAEFGSYDAPNAAAGARDEVTEVGVIYEF